MQTMRQTTLIAALLVSACATTPASRHYTLAANAQESHRIAADKRRIEIVSVRIPEALDRPQVVLTQSANEVSFSEFHRWAAPLRAEVPRVVARNLSRILDTSTLWLREDFAGTQPDLRLQVTIERLEAMPGEAMRLQALWMIRPAEGGAPQIGRSTVSAPLNDGTYAAAVVAIGQALLHLSQDLAKAIQATPM